jgi:hypothetical protein
MLDDARDAANELPPSAGAAPQSVAGSRYDGDGQSKGAEMTVGERFYGPETE